jgi:alanine racemase
VLVLSEQPDVRVRRSVDRASTHRVPGRDRRRLAASADRVRSNVHVKVDTGMQRVGAAPSSVTAVARHLATLAPALRVDAVFTHLACADEPTDPSNAQQLSTFDAALDELAATGLLPSVVHAANSAAALAIPVARRSLVRPGIALYGISSGPGVAELATALRPVMSLRARVSYVKAVAAGSHISYGWRHRFAETTTVATVPIGYADGVPRRLGTLPDRPGTDVLIGGRRHPIVGVVTMDQLMVDVGDQAVDVGDEVVLLGSQGDEHITAEDWADRLGTIGYEIVCGISARVPRIHTRA